VRKPPGSTIVTFMPSGSTSLDSDSEKPSTPNFAAAYAARPDGPTRPPIDDIWITCPEMARSFLEPIGKQMTTAGLGTLSEIFDGDAPFNPRGCIAQAWTIAEFLRPWRATFG